MALNIETLYEGSLELQDLYTISSVTKTAAKRWTVKGYIFTGVIISKIQLYIANEGHSGYARNLYAILQHNTVTGKSNAIKRTASVSKRNYILVGISVDGATEHSYANTLRTASKIDTAYNWRSGYHTIYCGKEPTTYTVSSVAINVGSMAMYPASYQTVFSYNGEPITYEIPQKTVSKIEVNNGSHSGISVDYLDDDWNTTNYFTIGDTKTLPDMYDRNGKWEFEGWYLDSDLTEPAPTSFEVAFDDSKLYTKWKQVQPHVTVGIDGGLRQGEIRIRKGNKIITPWKGYKKVNGIWRPIS